MTDHLYGQRFSYVRPKNVIASGFDRIGVHKSPLNPPFSKGGYGGILNGKMAGPTSNVPKLPRLPRPYGLAMTNLDPA